MVEISEFFCSSWLGHTLMDGVEEVIGRTGVYAVTNLASTSGIDQRLAVRKNSKKSAYRDLMMVQLALEDMYGLRGGCGIMLRAGRACFKHILHQYGVPMGIVDLNYRLLPVPNRLKSGLNALARQYATLAETGVTLEEQDNRWLWIETDCPFCYGRDVNESVCSFTIGLLQEYLTWASGGRVYSVWEVECQAMGKPACIIQIDKQPLD